MTDNVGQVEAVLFRRWADAIALREAMAELEGRMSERLEKAAESLQPWLEERGYSFVEVEAKYARVNVARASWMNKKRQQPWVWFALDALFPFGFRKVQEEHPLVWVMTYNLEKDDRRVFQEHLTNRLRGKGGTGSTRIAAETIQLVTTSPRTAIASALRWRKRRRRLHPSRERP